MAFNANNDLYDSIQRHPDRFWRFVALKLKNIDRAIEELECCARDVMGLNRIILGCDYPYEDLDEITQFIDGLSISEVDREAIYSRNAIDHNFV